ncbi:MAG: lipocalin-like domain-containing protein [Pseudomonadales bacterium]
MRRRELLAAGVAAPLAGWSGAAAAAAPLRLDQVLGSDDGAGFARAEGPRPFDFPADHGPHPAFRSEWWYLTASLQGDDGAEFGLQFTLFRQALRPVPAEPGPWDATQIYLGHLAVTDVGAGRHRHWERLVRGHPRLAGVTAAPFRAWIDGWSLTAAGPGLERMLLQASGDGVEVGVTFDPVKPLVLQGEDGFSRKGPGQASYYYTLPRLAAGGSLRLGSRTHTVGGTGWLDREWSTSVLSDAQEGWDWFSLQLDDGVDVMAFRLRRRDGVRDVHDHGMWVAADGTATRLDAADYTLRPLRRWRDDTGTAWPVAWQVSVSGPAGPVVWRVEAALDDQRMDTLLTYWEGLVRVFDEAGARIGSGYLELTGYG